MSKSAENPAASLGFLGGGQLARMMAVSAHRLGLTVGVLDPDARGPAAQLCHRVFQGAWDAREQALELARFADVLTLDTEHVPADLLDELEEHSVVRPSPAVLRTVQNRATQRAFLDQHGLPQTAYALVSSTEDTARAGDTTGFPAVLKTCTEGYDGRGQRVVKSMEELLPAWKELGSVPCVLEGFVDFRRELSIVLARGLSGETAEYPLIENEHRDHVLHISFAPADVEEGQQTQARQIAETIAGAFDYVGVIAVELFETRDGNLLVNEIAPRTHNSGHLTLGAGATCQFEQHVRAVSGLPLGSANLTVGGVMLNLLGDLWKGGEPDWSVVLADPSAHLHLYGKAKPRAGRKMGHVTFLDNDIDAARARAQAIHAQLAASAE